MSWYDQGYSGVDREEERKENMYGPGRLYLPPGNSRDLVFVDDDPFCIYEHNPKIGGNYKNWLTCVQGVHDDVVCCQMLGPQTRYYCGYLTIVDCSEWKDQRGNTHKYELKLLQAKTKTLKRFRRKKEDKGRMSGSMYTSTREDDKSPSCGDEFEFKRDVDMAKLFEHATYKGKLLSEMWDEAEKDEKAMERLRRTFAIKPNAEGKLPRAIVPFNYFEVLKPRAPKELRATLGAVQKDDDRGGGGGGGGKRGGRNEFSDEDDTPF